jgi:molybdopterin synthase catalytic subunit
MQRELRITRKTHRRTGVNCGAAHESADGAAVYFLGVVRDDEQGEAIHALDYEAFEEMVHHQFGLIFDEVEKRWPVESVRLWHRIGVVKVNEPSLWVKSLLRIVVKLLLPASI